MMPGKKYPPANPALVQKIKEICGKISYTDEQQAMILQNLDRWLFAYKDLAKRAHTQTHLPDDLESYADTKFEVAFFQLLDNYGLVAEKGDKSPKLNDVVNALLALAVLEFSDNDFHVEDQQFQEPLRGAKIPRVTMQTINHLLATKGMFLHARMNLDVLKKILDADPAKTTQERQKIYTRIKDEYEMGGEREVQPEFVVPGALAKKEFDTDEAPSPLPSPPPGAVGGLADPNVLKELASDIKEPRAAVSTTAPGVPEWPGSTKEKAPVLSAAAARSTGSLSKAKAAIEAAAAQAADVAAQRTAEYAARAADAVERRRESLREFVRRAKTDPIAVAPPQPPPKQKPGRPGSTPRR